MQDIFRVIPDLAARHDKWVNTGPTIPSRRKLVKDAAVIMGAVAAGGLLAGCGLSGSESPKPIDVPLKTLAANPELYENSLVTTVGNLFEDELDLIKDMPIEKLLPNTKGEFVWTPTTANSLSVLTSPDPYIKRHDKNGHEEIVKAFDSVNLWIVGYDIRDGLSSLDYFIHYPEVRITGAIIKIRGGDVNDKVWQNPIFAIDPSITVPFLSTPTSR